MRNSLLPHTLQDLVPLVFHLFLLLLLVLLSLSIIIWMIRKVIVWKKSKIPFTAFFLEKLRNFWKDGIQSFLIVGKKLHEILENTFLINTYYILCVNVAFLLVSNRVWTFVIIQYQVKSSPKICFRKIHQWNFHTRL